MTKKTFVDPQTGVVFQEEVPPFNVWSGRDTSMFALVCPEPSLTDQSFVAESDVNAIMARALQTGSVPVYADRQPFYGDFTDMPSYMDMQNVLIEADNAFMALPSAIRARFENDPAKFIEFANDPKNAEQLADWGLLSPEAVDRLDAAKAAKAAEAAAAANAAAQAGAGSFKPASESDAGAPHS